MFWLFVKNINNQIKSITSAAVIIGIAGLTSKILGVIRDRVLAGQFGAGRELDIYYSSFRIPDLIFNLLILGALSAGFIPIFTEYFKKSTDEAWRLINVVLSFLLIVVGGVSIILVLSAPFFMHLVAPGFTDQELAITIHLTRLMFLSPILLGISALFGGVLQSLRRFLVYALAPIAYNLGIIFGALFLTDFFGILGLAFGVILGALLHLLIQASAVFSLGYRIRWILDFTHRGLREILVLMVPRTLSLAVMQINFLVVVVLGSMLTEGSITVFHFAYNLESVPLGIFALSFAIASFPTLAEMSGEKEKFSQIVSATIRQILFFIIPISALFIVLRAQIVRVVLGAGNFDWEDTILTMNALGIFAISLFAQSLIPLMNRAFYAQKDSKTPFFIGIISAVLNIFLSVIFLRYFDVTESFFYRGHLVSPILGLVLAFTISHIVWLLLLWIALKTKMGELDEINIFYSSAKMALSAFGMVVTIQFMKYGTEPFFGTQTFIGIFLQGAISAVIGMVIYFVLCSLLRVTEAKTFALALRKKFFKKYIPYEPID